MPRQVAQGFCVLVLVLGLVHGAGGQVIYSDGAAHTIPGDPAFTNGQSITLQSASGLIVNDGASVDGDSASSNQSATAGAAISGLAGTNVTQNDGIATGGESNVVADGLSVTPMSSTGGAGISIGGSYLGNGGDVVGGHAFADGAFGVDVPSEFVTATGGAGLTLNSGAIATLQGVALTGGESQAWTASVLVRAVGGAAMSLNDSGPVTIASGTFTGGLADATNYSVFSGDATGQGGAAIDVHGSSSLTINGGYFEGGSGGGVVVFIPTQGTGIGGAALRITGPASVTVNDGSFRSGSAGAGTIPPTIPITTSDAAITVVGDSAPGNLRLIIVSGSFQGLHALQTTGTSPNATDARIDILGGDFDTVNARDLSLGNPNITTRIYGSSFLLNGNPVALGAISELIGTLEGFLADSSAFEWTFERLNDAPLILAAVPEPGAVAPIATIVPFLIRRRRV